MSISQDTVLQTITLEFPSTRTEFVHHLFELLEPLGKITHGTLIFTGSNKDYLPQIKLSVAETDECRAIFTLTNTQKLTATISNMTGVEKAPEHKYGYYTLEQVKKRLKGINLVTIDHAGFNLPWFMGGTHPIIGFLQANLKNKSLYHSLQIGEGRYSTVPLEVGHRMVPEDFILPATVDEIQYESAIDYRQIRKPKFELVSFEKSSTPLIQLDVATNGTYTTIKERFPDGLHVDELKQTWVYINNPFGLDICLVLNEDSGSDWSEQFALSRLQ